MTKYTKDAIAKAFNRRSKEPNDSNEYSDEVTVIKKPRSMSDAEAIARLRERQARHRNSPKYNPEFDW